MSVDRMTCMSCSRTKAYPDGFPNRAYAECWECAWNSHVRNKHPEVIKRIKRAAKKRARRLSERSIYEAMSEAERRQVYPTTPPTDAAEAAGGADRG